jgi:pimeloyl-ACP methyl ester carboxylesterase
MSISSSDLHQAVVPSLKSSFRNKPLYDWNNRKRKNIHSFRYQSSEQASLSRARTVNLAQSSDQAGNNRRLARQLGDLINNQVYKFKDAIGQTDPNDFYTFTLDMRSNLRINASGLTKDTNLRFFSTNGKNLFQTKDSPESSNSAIQYTQILDPGTYFVQLNKRTDDTTYNLKLKPVSLTGDIKNNDLSYKNGVNFYHYDDQGRTNDGIEPNKNTIVVIHGRGSSSESTEIKALSLEAAKDYDNKGYQVLALDWQQPADDSGIVPFTAARAIAPVAQWATQTLGNLGLAKNRITIFGHSLGAYVGADIGQLYNGVRQLVALDPAFPAQQYDLDGNQPGDQNVPAFSGLAKRSLALVVQDSQFSLDSVAGDNDQASTAQDSLLVKYDSSSSLGPTRAHNTVINVFRSALSKAFLKLDDNLALPPHVQNVYNNSGKLVKQGGLHEGQILAKRDGTIEQLIYVDRKIGNKLEQTKTWD